MTPNPSAKPGPSPITGFDAERFEVSRIATTEVNPQTANGELRQVETPLRQQTPSGIDADPVQFEKGRTAFHGPCDPQIFDLGRQGERAQADETEPAITTQLSTDVLRHTSLDDIQLARPAGNTSRGTPSTGRPATQSLDRTKFSD